MDLKKRMKWVGLGIIGVAMIFTVNMLAWAATPVKKADQTVGYIDMDRIQKEHPDFIKLAEVLKDQQELFNMTQNSINKQLEIFGKELQSKAEKEKTGKSAEEQAKIDQKFQAELQVKRNELKDQLTQKGEEINKYLAEQTKAVRAKLDEIVAEIAKAKKLTVVLDKKAVHYGGMDITQAVLDKVKETAPKK